MRLRFVGIRIDGPTKGCEYIRPLFIEQWRRRDPVIAVLRDYSNPRNLKARLRSSILDRLCKAPKRRQLGA